MVCANPDPSQMAAEFLKSWQKQLAQSMNDPATIRAMLESMKFFYGAGADTHDAHARRPAPAPDATGHAIDDLARRVARLEQSVAQLAKAQKPVGAKRRGVEPRVEPSKQPGKRTGKRVVKGKPAKPKRKK